MQIQQISEALYSEALGEYSQRSAKQYEQDQERQQQASAHTANDDAQHSSGSVSRSFNSNRARASNPNPVPNPGQDPDPGLDSSPPLSPLPPSPPPPPDPNSNSDPDSDPDPNPNPNPNPNPIPQPLHHVSPGGRPFVESVELRSLGPMNIQCPKCHALHFISKKLSNSGVHNPCFGICCFHGQVNLFHIQQWPHNLQDLLMTPRIILSSKRRFANIIMLLHSLLLVLTSMIMLFKDLI